LLKEHLNWVAGFVDGDGAFYFTVHKPKDYKYGYQVKASFDIAK
jgi:LAGLIDADG endonuclease